jgi:8-oxo-dGTP pyrophosphatase MutT (NUDIX family)
MDIGSEALNNRTDSTKIRVGVLLSQVDPFTKETQFLILRKTRNGMWGFAGGSVEDNENFRKAALRELAEETQLKEKSFTISKTANTVTVNMKYGAPTREYVLFNVQYHTPMLPVNIAVIDDPKFKQPEHFEFRWVSRKSDLKHLQFGSDDLKKILMKELK